MNIENSFLIANFEKVFEIIKIRVNAIILLPSGV